MDSTCKVALIGTGRHTRANIYPVLKLLGTNVTAVCARQLVNAEKAIADFGFQAKAYDDYHLMLQEEEIDKVIVVVTAEDAAEIVSACLKAGKQVFTEKPLGMSVEEAREIEVAARQGQSAVMVGYMKRFAPVYQKLKEDGERLGRLCGFQARFLVDGSNFCSNDRDYFYYVATHFLDLVLWLFGSVEEVHAISYDTMTGSSYQITLRMGSDAVGSIYFESHSAWSREEESITATYENGFIETKGLNSYRIHEINKQDHTILGEEDRCFTVTDTPSSGMSRDLYLRGFAGELRYFLENDITQTHDNLKVTELTDRILDDLEY